MTNQEFEEYADYCRSLGLDNCPRLQVAAETPCADNDNACNLRWFEAVGDCCQIKKPQLGAFILVKLYQESLAYKSKMLYNCNSFVTKCKILTSCGK